MRQTKASNVKIIIKNCILGSFLVISEDSWGFKMLIPVFWSPYKVELKSFNLWYDYCYCYGKLNFYQRKKTSLRMVMAEFKQIGFPMSVLTYAQV